MEITTTIFECHKNKLGSHGRSILRLWCRNIIEFVNSLIKIEMNRVLISVILFLHSWCLSLGEFINSLIITTYGNTHNLFEGLSVGVYVTVNPRRNRTVGVHCVPSTQYGAN